MLLIDEYRIFIHFFFELRLPFDSRTPLGYLVVFIIQSYSAYYVTLVIMFMMTFLITSIWTLMAASSDDIKGDINHLNEMAKFKRNEKSVNKTLCKVIMFDVDIKG